jgi:hypothetical protein
MVERLGGQEAAEELLSRLQPTALAGDLAGSVREALAILGQSELATRRLVVLTDGQEALDPRLNAGPMGVEVQLLTVAPPSAANLYLADLSLPPLLQVRAERRLGVRVVNGGEGRALGSVRLNVAGRYLGERAVDLQPGSSAELRFDVGLEPGVQLGFVELDGDDLEVDNRRFFVLGLDARVPVLVVGAPEVRRYVELALGVEEESSRSGFEVRSAASLSELPVPAPGAEPARAVVLCGLSRLGQAELEALRSLRAGGAGVLLFLGPETTPSFVNEALGNNAPLPLRLAGRESGTWTGRAQQSRHSALPGAARLGALLESTEFRERHRIVPLGQGASALLTYSDGEPLLVELRAQSPPVLVFTTSADRSFGDLVLSPYFVLLLRRSVDHACGVRDRGALAVGAARPPASALAGEGGQWLLVADPAELQPRLEAPEVLSSPGALVQIGAEGRVLQWKEVAVEPTESLLTYPGRPIDAGGAFATADSVQGRRSIAFGFLVLALLLLVAEGLLTASLTAREATG